MKTAYNLLTFITLLGLAVLNHYLYEWLDLKILGLIFPKNESIFEHLKLLYFPSLLSLICDTIVIKEKGNCFVSYTFSLLIGLIFIIVSFYTYSGIIGKNLTFIDISIMIISIILFIRVKNDLLKDNLEGYLNMAIVLYVLLLMTIIIFTIKPLDIPFFK